MFKDYSRHKIFLSLVFSKKTLLCGNKMIKMNHFFVYYRKLGKNKFFYYCTSLCRTSFQITGREDGTNNRILLFNRIFFYDFIDSSFPIKENFLNGKDHCIFLMAISICAGVFFMKHNYCAIFI